MSVDKKRRPSLPVESVTKETRTVRDDRPSPTSRKRREEPESKLPIEDVKASPKRKSVKVKRTTTPAAVSVSSLHSETISERGSPSDVASVGVALPDHKKSTLSVKGDEYTEDRLREMVLQAFFGDEWTTRRHGGGAREERLPGPLPATANRFQLSQLRHLQYCVFEKSDGERRLLLAIHQHAWWIDRRFRFTPLETMHEAVLLPKDHRGLTLLDGELVEHCVSPPSSDKTSLSTRTLSAEAKGETAVGVGLVSSHHDEAESLKTETRPRYFLVFDVISIRGERLVNMLFPQRHERPLLKWKWPGSDTVDFKVSPTPGKSGWLDMYLRFPDGEHRVRSTPLLPSDRPWLNRIQRYRVDEKCIVEMAYAREHGQWTIQKIREDKAEANFFTTGWSTLEAAIEATTERELYALLTSPAVSAVVSSSSSDVGVTPTLSGEGSTSLSSSVSHGTTLEKQLRRPVSLSTV